MKVIGKTPFLWRYCLRSSVCRFIMAQVLCFGHQMKCNKATCKLSNRKMFCKSRSCATKSAPLPTIAPQMHMRIVILHYSETGFLVEKSVSLAWCCWGQTLPAYWWLKICALAVKSFISLSFSSTFTVSTVRPALLSISADLVVRIVRLFQSHVLRNTSSYVDCSARSSLLLRLSAAWRENIVGPLRTVINQLSLLLRL